MEPSTPAFIEFPKMPRLYRECIITEKLDGTNASVCITDDGQFLTGSRSRWITPEDDNYGFSKWAHAHKEELLKLGAGKHFGEWWGGGIQRKYGLAGDDKRFSLFNILRWSGDDKDKLPRCVGLVPVLYQGPFSTLIVDNILDELRDNVSKAVQGFMNPEGIVTFHVAANMGFKTTLLHDEIPKGKIKA